MKTIFRLRRAQQDPTRPPGYLVAWLPYFLVGLERGPYKVAWTWPTRADHPAVPAKRPARAATSNPDTLTMAGYSGHGG